MLQEKVYENEKEYFTLKITYDRQEIHQISTWSMDHGYRGGRGGGGRRGRRMISECIQQVKICSFDTYVPHFMVNKQVLEGKSDEYVKDRLFIHPRVSFDLPPTCKCKKHMHCSISYTVDIEKVEITYPYGMIRERRLVTFLLGMDNRVGGKSNISKHFKGVFGETAVIGLIKDFM